MFRTINGGASWVKVSPNDDLHNITTLAEDPRVGFQDIWYYATGKRVRNSASFCSTFRGKGRGICKSLNNGVTWNQYLLKILLKKVLIP